MTLVVCLLIIFRYWNVSELAPTKNVAIVEGHIVNIQENRSSRKFPSLLQEDTFSSEATHLSASDTKSLIFIILSSSN